MRHILSILFVLNALQAQGPQAKALARQQAAILKQRQALDAGQGSIGRQLRSIQRQSTRAKLAPDAAPDPDAGCAPPGSGELDEMIAAAARQNGLTPDLLREVIRRESAFRPCAVSRSGAMGLMQLMPGTAFDLGVRDPFDPAQNIAAGSRFLRLMLDRFGGDLPLALGAYNAGPARVSAAGGVPPIRETQDYVQGITRALAPAGAGVR
jgi:soluble lytic murein transglycosylase-like protein